MNLPHVLNNDHYRTAALLASGLALVLLLPVAIAAEDDATLDDALPVLEDAQENEEAKADDHATADDDESAVDEDDAGVDAETEAEEAEVAGGVDWSGEVSAGFLAASGNTESRSTNAQARTEMEIGRFEHRLSGRFIQTRDSGSTSAERYSSAYQVDFTIGERNFLFFAADFDKDLFGGVRQKTTQTTGYGRKFLDSERHRFRAELGAGARQLRFQPPGGGYESELIGRFFTEYRLNFRDDNRILQSVEVEVGDSNTQTESMTELRISIIGNLYASASYTVRHNSSVDGDAKKLDTFSALNLTYSFGDQ